MKENRAFLLIEAHKLKNCLNDKLIVVIFFNKKIQLCFQNRIECFCHASKFIILQTMLLWYLSCFTRDFDSKVFQKQKTDIYFVKKIEEKNILIYIFDRKRN